MDTSGYSSAENGGKKSMNLCLYASSLGIGQLLAILLMKDVIN